MSGPPRPRCLAAAMEPDLARQIAAARRGVHRGGGFEGQGLVGAEQVPQAASEGGDGEAGEDPVGSIVRVTTGWSGGSCTLLPATPAGSRHIVRW